MIYVGMNQSSKLMRIFSQLVLFEAGFTHTAIGEPPFCIRKKRSVRPIFPQRDVG
jgi:hypothetical protein